MYDIVRWSYVLWGQGGCVAFTASRLLSALETFDHQCSSPYWVREDCFAVVQEQLRQERKEGLRLPLVVVGFAWVAAADHQSKGSNIKLLHVRM